MREINNEINEIKYSTSHNALKMVHRNLFLLNDILLKLMKISELIMTEINIFLNIIN